MNFTSDDVSQSSYWNILKSLYTCIHIFINGSMYIYIWKIMPTFLTSQKISNEELWFFRFLALAVNVNIWWSQWSRSKIKLGRPKTAVRCSATTIPEEPKTNNEMKICCAAQNKHKQLNIKSLVKYGKSSVRKMNRMTIELFFVDPENKIIVWIVINRNVILRCPVRTKNANMRTEKKKM